MDPVLESVTLEPELEEALANASDAELCDIAGKTVSCELGGFELFDDSFLFVCSSVRNKLLSVFAVYLNAVSFDRMIFFVKKEVYI